MFCFAVLNWFAVARELLSFAQNDLSLSIYIKNQIDSTKGNYRLEPFLLFRMEKRVFCCLFRFDDKFASETILRLRLDCDSLLHSDLLKRDGDFESRFTPFDNDTKLEW